MSRWATMLLIGMVITLAIVLLVLFQGREHTESSQPGAAAGPAAGEPTSTSAREPAVQVMKPQRRDILRSISLPANISPWYQATLYGKVSGYLKWIGFDKGDRVKKGQLLAVIDAPEIEDQYRQAEADYAIKKITFDRYLSVWKENKDMIAKQDVDVAEAAAQAAKHVRDSRKTLLEYTKVYAPFDGTITARFADPGALIQSATGSATQAVPLFTIMDMDKLRVYVSVPQEEAFYAKPGIPATLTATELPEKVFKAAITRTTESLDPATRTLLVEIDVENAERILQPGMFINATLELERHAQALTVPPAAIAPSPKGKAVFIVKDGHARKVAIKTGLDDGRWIEVLDGLTESDDVVVVGKSALTDGQAVTVSAYNLPEGKPASQKM